MSVSQKSNFTLQHKAIEIVLKEVLYNSLAQILIRLIRNPYKILLKLFLFTFVLISIGLASYLVIRSIVDYFTYGVSTTLRTVFETPTLFPKVTFCNINPFTTEYAFNLTQNGIYYGNDLSNEEKQRLDHDLNDIILECKFNNNHCVISDFTWSYDEVYGNCYTFNSGFNSTGSRVVLKESNMAGPYFGLHLTLYVNIYEKLIDFEKILGLGAIIRIGNSSYSTYDSNNGILVPSGHQTNIAIGREFKSILPKPYSNCEIDSISPPTLKPGLDLFNIIAQSQYDYSQQLCFSQCIQKKSIEKYNCTLFYLLSLFNKTQCNSYQENVILSSVDSFDSNFISKVCLPMCPLECNQTLYKTSISSSRLLGRRFYFDSVKKNPNLANDFLDRILDSLTIERSIVSVNIFYESLSYMESTESPQMNIVSLLASMGGNLSLFLGVSVFTLAEIVEVVIEIYFIVKRMK
jgi:hypothetical protein